jgi:non-ribosomal peptide synthase protein (TIGR01720 family)
MKRDIDMTALDAELLQTLAQTLSERLGRSAGTLSEEEIQAHLELLLAQGAASDEIAICAHVELERHAARAPDALALVLDDARLPRAQMPRWSYATLNRRANQLAHRLRRYGIGPESVVAVELESPLERTVALLAVHKAGGAYLALDPGAPPACRARWLGQARPRLVLAEAKHAGSLTPGDTPALLIDGSTVHLADHSSGPIASEPGDDLAIDVPLSAPACLVVVADRLMVIDHDALAHRLRTLQSICPLGARDRLLASASAGLEAAIWEALWPLTQGATLVLAPAVHGPGSSSAPALAGALAGVIAGVIDAQQISVVHLTPGLLRSLVAAADADEAVDLGPLRQVLCSGGPLRAGVVAALHRHSQAKLGYCYDPPGASAFVTVHDGEARQVTASLPLGRPSSSHALHVLDDYLQPVPPGVVGELCVTGGPLGRWFPEGPKGGAEGAQTAGAARFVPSPFASAGGERLLRTGDRGRRLHDGSFELVPAGSRQAHVEGHVIDLDWVAAELLGYPMDDCVVLARETSAGEPQLIAYTVLSGPFVEAELRRHAEAVLPRPCVPTAFVPIASLPLTAAGHVDDRALQALPVLDDALTARWEAELGAMLATDHVAVVAPASARMAAAEAPDPSQWFWRPVWRRKRLGPGQRRPDARTCVLFCEAELELGRDLARALAAAGNTVVTVHRAGVFVRMGDNHYGLDPVSPAHHDALAAALAEAGLAPDDVFHLWTYHPGPLASLDGAALERHQQRDAATLLNLLRSLARPGSPPRACRLWVISSQMQPVLPGEDVDCTHASLPGLLRTVPHELPGLVCRHIDLGVAGDGGREDHLGHVLDELGTVAGEREVAYRRGQRWIARLERVDLTGTPPRPSPFKAGGTYLISGGLGGIGRELSRRLVEEHGAKVLLAGRSGPPASLADRVSELRELGDRARYIAVDVADQAALAQAVQVALADWRCKLDGVIHLAGSVEERRLLDEDPADLSARLRPSLSGSWNLHQLIAGDPEALFISFASINGFFGGALVGAYAAASSFLERFAHHLRARGARSHCYAWSIWRGIGISQSYQMVGPSQARGYQLIEPEQGWKSLLLGLEHGLEQLYVGLEGRNPHVRRHVDGRDVEVQTIAGFVAGRPESSLLVDASRSELPDRFGSPTRCVLVQIGELPRTPDGAVDRERLALMSHGRELRVEQVAPRNPVEQQLATVWQELLRVPRIGIHDKFFELGGDSLLAIQLIARAGQLGLRLSAEQVFRHQTIAQLAEVCATTRTIHAEQGLVTGPVPLTPAQHFFFAHDMRVPDHFNHAYQFHARTRLEPALLERALHHVVAHHDALRSRFVRTGSGWSQTVAAEEPGVLSSFMDLRELPESERWSSFEARATELQGSLSLAEGPLLRVLVAERGPGQPQRVLVIIHHLVVDGLSWRILLEDLSTAYLQLSARRPVELPPKTTSFQYWAQRLVAHAGSAEVAADLDYWLQRTWPDAAGIPHDLPGQNLERCADNVALELDAGETQQLLSGVPRRFGVKIADVMQAAMVRTIARWTGTRRLLVDIAHHGRRELFDDVDLSRTVGWFSTFHPVLLDLGPSADPVDELRAIQQQLDQVPQQGFSHGLLRYLSSDPAVAQRLAAAPRPQVLLTYQGQFEPNATQAPLLELVDSAAGPIHHGESRRMYQLVFNQLVSQGQLGLGLTYSNDLHRRETVERLAHGYFDALRELITHSTDA